MVLVEAEEAQNHIRPFVPHRDLDDLATLIEIAFSRELELTGSTIVRDLRQMARWSPLIASSASMISPFLGFVWVDHGHVVGNVSLTRNSSRRIWTMSNVAVLPEYRGRGIAGRLVDIAIQYVIRSHGRMITLQVRRDNDVARQMYLSRGFASKMSWHELQLSPECEFSALGTQICPIRRVRFGDRKGIAALYGLTAKSQLGAPFSFGARIAFVLEGQRLVERCVRKDGRIVAIGVARSRGAGGVYQAELRVLPAYWAVYERDLLYALFSSIRRGRFGPVQALIPGVHTAAREAACSLGMTPLRVLEEMELILREPEED